MNFMTILPHYFIIIFYTLRLFILFFLTFDFDFAIFSLYSAFGLRDSPPFGGVSILYQVFSQPFFNFFYVECIYIIELSFKPFNMYQSDLGYNN